MWPSVYCGVRLRILVPIAKVLGMVGEQRLIQEFCRDTARDIGTPYVEWMMLPVFTPFAQRCFRLDESFDHAHVIQCRQVASLTQKDRTDNAISFEHELAVDWTCFIGNCLGITRGRPLAEAGSL